MSNKVKVTEIYDNEEFNINFLEQIFQIVTNTGTSENPSYFFQTIMIPVRDYDSQTQKLSDTYTYHNVGMTCEQLSDIYWAEYSGHYFLGAGCGKTIVQDVNFITKRCKSIFKKNYGKYLRLVEMEGLEWNPLWNVDGTEIRQILENEGTTDITVTPDSRTLTHSTASYDDSEKTEWTETDSGSTSTTYTHNHAKNTVNGVEAEYTVDADDTAFGYGLSGGGKMHVEKYVRQGNIGVTKTTELIEDARRSLQFSVIQEFFRDINKVILIGIYDN